ncbi:hypothetical protein EVAR_12671_1 [Eumeta japonica]|uniref:Uncharacterized protein n=1 Tax=Eumeta variegata TaxID=151549 RepID=A0A4C1Z1H5_EUMVA|nr:hypothetical protein EVAR_12671_1 [Eumeta japonica]
MSAAGPSLRRTRRRNGTRAESTRTQSAERTVRGAMQERDKPRLLRLSRAFWRKTCVEGECRDGVQRKMTLNIFNYINAVTQHKHLVEPFYTDKVQSTTPVKIVILQSYQANGTKRSHLLGRRWRTGAPLDRFEAMAAERRMLP